MVFGIVYIGVHPDSLVSEVLASAVLKLTVNFKTDFQIVQNEILINNGLTSWHFK